jgi:hypothetical protein
MGVYRYHSGGLYSAYSEARKLEETLKFYKVMDRNLNHKYGRLVNVAISKYFFEWAEEYFSRGDLERARFCYKTCLTGRPVNKFVSLKKLFRMGLKLYKPFLPTHTFHKFTL